MNYQVMSKFQSMPSLTLTVGIESHEQTNDKSRIILKNLIREAKSSLEEKFRHVDCTLLLKHLDELENEFQFSVVSESVIFFVSNEMKTSMSVPFMTESEFHLGDRFMTRKLLRNSNKMSHYYVVTLNSDEARLLEYQNDQLIHEFKDDRFPIANNGFWTSDRLLNSMGSVRTNYQKEFYKWIDAELQSYLTKNPHPIILAGSRQSVDIYKEIANRNDLIIGSINGNFTFDKGESTVEIGAKAYEVVEAYLSSQLHELVEGLTYFESRGRLEKDLKTIYQLAISGRGQKLVVDEEYYQEGTINDGEIQIDKVNSTSEEFTEDVVNEIIYQIMKYGGEVVFVTKEQLKPYQNSVLQMRY
ncbi:hypothetical protein [Carnobacterium maltaromaticum]|uniref:baeRF3 domain-containing protein n=1 Tax=Carnobacterium maltaromaticum TaxID=2751 RepID=UPI00191BB207|nr:hypothetical protein [Carnobacterium maltaromaticum]CAD5900131.1 conserved hypothetical protein [Carnobacterium maltaromaticum]